MGILDGHAAITTQLKGAYTRIILPFEKFGEHVRGTGGNGESQRAPTYATRNSGGPRTGRSKASGSARSEALNKSANGDAAENPESAPNSPMSSVLSDLPDDGERPDAANDEPNGTGKLTISNTSPRVARDSH